MAEGLPDPPRYTRPQERRNTRGSLPLNLKEKAGTQKQDALDMLTKLKAAILNDT
jgi:hypothetical protein